MQFKTSNQQRTKKNPKMIKNKITRVKEEIQVKKKIINQRKRMEKEKIQRVNKKLIKNLINTIYKIMIIKI